MTALVKIKNNITFFAEEGESILDAALRQGVVLEYSCKSGQCGVCAVNVSSGSVVEIRDQVSLSSSERQKGKVLTCCCSVGQEVVLDAEDLTALKGIEIKTLPARIESIHKYSSDLIKVRLRLPPAANFSFLEGQFVDVIWGDVRRSYSLANASFEDGMEFFIKRFSNGIMSEYWFKKAAVNDLLRVEGPKGTFFLREKAESIVFLATGTGIAPIVSILKKMNDQSELWKDSAIYLFWGNRIPEEFAYEYEFLNLNLNVQLVTSQFEANDEYQQGYVQDVALANLSQIHLYSVYACGSSEMIFDAKKKFMSAGLLEGKFYSDAFVQSY